MINYYTYFGFDKKASIHEVLEKTSIFLAYARNKISKLNDEEDKEELLHNILILTNDVYSIFSQEDKRAAYDESIKKEMCISTRVLKTKKNVVPFDDFYVKAKRSWLRILKSLIPYLEAEKQMTFLINDSSFSEILNFIIENVVSYYKKEGVKNNSIIPIEIIKDSFDIASSRGRNVVKIEDVVSSIINCEYLEKSGRNKLAVLMFDKWYETPKQKKELACKKKC
ncbi:MAG: hypothetical protein PHT75_00460 [Bacilli bacterium]|nr:hypothetical protein [Bacilli bacterium]MDD3304590.1 hypothetical protein [Bacilli bacterium]